jgi:hypothetical protein
MKTKDIIGYNLKDKKYLEAAKLLSKFWDETCWTNFQVRVTSGAEKDFKEAGVLDIWFEPVYEKELFKIDDWVIGWPKWLG